MFGKLGSGKRTLTAQIAIGQWKQEIKNKNGQRKDLLSVDLVSMQSTVLVIHNPVKSWFTSKHSNEIMSCLAKICTNTPKNWLLHYKHFPL